MNLNQIFTGEVLASIEPLIEKLNKMWDDLVLSPDGLPAEWMGYSLTIPTKTASQPKVQFHLRDLRTAPGLAQPKLAAFATEAGITHDFRHGGRFSGCSGMGAAPGPAVRAGHTLLYFDLGPTGTLTGFVELPGQAIYLLTAGHVLAPFGNVPSSPLKIWDKAVPSPIVIDHPTILFGPLRDAPGERNSADVGVQQWNRPKPAAPLYQGIKVSANSLDRERLARQLTIGAVEVIKIGTGTFPEKQTGTLASFAPRLLVDFEGQLSVPMENQFLVSDGASPFSALGDSGAMAFVGTEDLGYFPIGMLIARRDSAASKDAGTSEVFTVVTPLPAVLAAACDIIHSGENMSAKNNGGKSITRDTTSKPDISLLI